MSEEGNMSMDSDERRAMAEEDSAMWDAYVQKVAADERWRKSLRGRIRMARLCWMDRRR